MLDRQSKKVLKSVLKHIDELQDTQCPLVLEKYLRQYNATDIEKSLWYLNETGYISCSSADDTVWRIDLTYKGEKCFELRRLEFMNFFKISVLTPIIVATITTLLVNFLSNYF